MSAERSPKGKKGRDPEQGKGPDYKKHRYWKAVRMGAVFGIIEFLSLVLWVKSEDFDHESARQMRWMAACGFLAGGAYLAHKLLGENRRKMWITIIWVTWASVCCGLIFLKSDRPEPTFRAAGKAAFIGMVPGQFPLWLVQSGKGGDTIRCPATTLMWIELINLQSLPCMVESYSVEVKIGDKWVSQTEMDVRFGQLFITPSDARQATPLDCRQNGFDAILDNKDIGPRETIHGWMLFEDAVFGNIRLRIKDTSGHESIVPLDQTKAGSGTQVQMAKMSFGPGPVQDISNIRQVAYADRYNQNHDPQPAYIEGTEITQKQLADLFPFGYAVFFFGQNRVLRNEIFKNEMMDWKIDVDKVEIRPDFNSGTVSWTIPNVSAASSTNNRIQVLIHGGTFNVVCPLKKGFMKRAGFNVGNQPVMYVDTLGDNQRNPVFAIGFRIPSPDEQGRPQQP